MLQLLRRHLRPTTALLLAVVLVSWVGSVSARHLSLGSAQPAAMIMAAMTPMAAADHDAGAPCAMSAAEMDRAGGVHCGHTCCVSLPEFAHGSRHAALQLPDWESTAVLYSATPTLPQRALVRAERAWPAPSPGSHPPLDTPFHSFRVLLI